MLKKKHTKQQAGKESSTTLSQSEKAKDEKVKQRDPNGDAVTQNKNDIVTAVNYLLSDNKPSIVVDGHMHIQSGHCVTLPFLWEKTGPLRGLRLAGDSIEGLAGIQDAIHDFNAKKRDKEIIAKNTAAADAGHNVTEAQKEMYRKHKLRDAIDVQKNDTYTIGKLFMKRRNDFYKDFLITQKYYKDVQKLLFSCIVMTMDMEYAHLDGYYGLKICNVIYKEGDPEKEPVEYWVPLHGHWSMDDRTKKGTYATRQDDRLVPVEDQTKTDFLQNKKAMKNSGVPGIYFDDAGKGAKMRIDAEIYITEEEETARYEQWKKQVQNTELAMLANPLKLLPLYHYDPRRWQVKDTGNAEPFAKVSGSGLYLGFKMYTAQGYRPMDSRLPILKQFYSQCCTQHIPIMNHCTPEGAPTFDLEEYINFRHPRDTAEDDKQKSDILNPPNDDTKNEVKSGNSQDKPTQYPPTAAGYFNRYFVSPEAWRPVLKEFKTLRLCLAHFGGNTEMGRSWCKEIINLMKEYPNVYTDISSSFANGEFRDFFRDEICKNADFEKTVRNRILFGTDWYLTLMDGKDYKVYCQTAKEFLDTFDNDLWFKFTQVNPYKFYRLDEEIDRIKDNIIAKRKTDEKVRMTLPMLTDKEILAINEEAAYIKKGNQGYINHQEKR